MTAQQGLSKIINPIQITTLTLSLRQFIELSKIINPIQITTGWGDEEFKVLVVKNNKSYSNHNVGTAVVHRVRVVKNSKSYSK